ncbi:MAG: hypothetical protein IKB46_01715 [Paludibacteraceae bacterium]|nr:hypothetical protein [Paludibacteraceae bacterium]
MKRFIQLFSLLICLSMSISMQAQVPTTAIGPVDSYGFLAGPDGNQWTYTASFTKQYGYYTSMTVEVYNAEHLLVGKIVDSLNIADPNVTGVRDVQVTGFVTKKFFNFDNNYELMLFVVANTKQYVNKYFNRIYSIVEGETSTQPVCEMPGNMVASKNIGEYSENYTVVFKRDSTNTTGMQYFDVYTKASYASPDAPELKHTFEIPYANLAALNDLFPIFMVKNGAYINYFTTQYEKPYFVPGTPVYEDPVVNENNSLVITQYDNKFNIIGETKIPMAKDPDEAYLYTFFSLGSLSGERDIILDYNGTGKPAFVITEDNYAIASDGSVYSYRLYDNEGNLLNTIAEYALGTIHMSDVAGYERQYGFLKNENEVEFVQMVDVPSCKTVARITLNNGGNILSGNWDRVAKGDSYQYVVSLLQGDVLADGSIEQRIAWFTNKGKVDHYDAINLGQKVEAANVWISASVLNPHLFNSDDAYEYATLIKREKETGNRLLICSTNGETLLELGQDNALGGDLNMVDVVNGYSNNPALLCVYTNGNSFTLNYFALPLTQTTIQGQGTAEDPYQIASMSDFMHIEQAPDAHYILVNDVDFMNVPFAGIRVPFTGVLNGDKHAFKNVVLNGSGLFAYVQDDAVIRDLKLSHPVMQLGEVVTSAGMLANTIQGNMSGDDGSMETETVAATLHNIHIESPKVVGDGYKGLFGGLVGEASLFVGITQSSVTEADINLPMAEGIGGLAGKLATASSVKACLFTGTINGGDAVGGMVAEAGSGEAIQHCHVDATLHGTNTIGGVIAYSQRAPIANCYVEGNLILSDKALVGKVGGVIGNLELDEMGNGPIVLANCLIGIESITLPIDSVYAHRVIGFSAGDKYNYFEQKYEMPETKIQGCYILSDLAAVDTSIQLTDTTTEGANLSAVELTTEWLSQHGFALGTTIDTPWSLSNTLGLWFEDDQIGTGIEDIWTDDTHTPQSMIRKMMINGQVLILRNGKLYNVMGNSL